MYIVRTKLNNKTIYALPFKTKKAAEKRYNKAKETFNSNGYDVELLKVDDNTNILQEYYIGG